MIARENHITSLVEQLRRGLKLPQPSAYLTLFWEQFDVGSCDYCRGIKAKALKNRLSLGLKGLGSNYLVVCAHATPQSQPS